MIGLEESTFCRALSKSKCMGRFQGPGIESLVESQQAITVNSDTSRLNVGLGADKVHDENDSKDSR